MRASEPTFPGSLGSFDARTTPVLQTDVLVVGAGIAGVSAALAAADAGARVLLVAKSGLSETNTAWAQGGVAAVLTDEDSLDLHMADTLRVGVGLSDPAITREIISKGPESVDWLCSLGAEFDRRPDGSLELGREGGHSVNRVVHASGDATGAEIQRVLGHAIERHPHITCKFGTFVRDLLVQDGRCVGAVLLADGDALAISAGAVVVASGGAGQMYRETTNPIGACGDGAAQCFRAGADLADMEFVQFHPTTLYIAGASRFLISEVVRGAGAVLRDRDGHRFMSEVHPSAELAPRDVVSRAILERMVETGDTHVYLDLSGLEGDPRKAFPSIARICAGFDIDIARDPIPVRPGAHYLIGGVRTDSCGRSTIPGLFAVGEAAATYLHGANRLASNSLLEGAVIGRCTGRRAAEERESVPLASTEAGPSFDTPAPRLHLDDMLYSLKSLMWRQVGLVRDEDGLAEARERIALWHHYLMRASTDRPGYELRNMLTVSALCATAALERRESRGTHFRRDFPQRDDAGCCHHILMRRAADGSIEVEHGPPVPPSDAP
ncbi:MAG: L-aspartate oxidase [Planctomycetes bacterium]|nr:L-aspartate oxidase [Planctomycetota bacterium]